MRKEERGAVPQGREGQQRLKERRWGFQGGCPFGRRAKPEKGRQRAKRTLEGGR